MGRIVHYSVKVHTCKLLQEEGQILENKMQPDERYVCVKNPRSDEKPYLEVQSKDPEYYRMAINCRCRKWITLFDAMELTRSGHAVWVYKVIKFAISRCEPGFPTASSTGHIWRPVVREKVPRIDLITKADVQRAYGLKHEKASKQQKEFRDYIEQVHEMTLELRAALIVPFRPDPFEDRTLFTFAPDDRTPGGRGK